MLNNFTSKYDEMAAPEKGELKLQVHGSVHWFYYCSAFSHAFRSNSLQCFVVSGRRSSNFLLFSFLPPPLLFQSYVCWQGSWNPCLWNFQCNISLIHVMLWGWEGASNCCFYKRDLTLRSPNQSWIMGNSRWHQQILSLLKFAEEKSLRRENLYHYRYQ